MLTERSVNITSGLTPERGQARSGNTCTAEGPVPGHVTGKWGAGLGRSGTGKVVGVGLAEVQGSGLAPLALSSPTGKGKQQVTQNPALTFY